MKDIQEIKKILDRKMKKNNFYVIDLDNNDDIRLFFDDIFINIHGYVNVQRTQFENNDILKIYNELIREENNKNMKDVSINNSSSKFYIIDILKVYNEFINEEINQNIKDASVNKNNSSYKFYINNINDVLTSINKTFTNYLEIINKKIIMFSETTVIEVKTSMSLKDIEDQIITIENRCNFYNNLYNNYKHKKNIHEYFQYIFERFPAPFWAMNDVDFKIKYNNKNDILFIDAILPSVNSIPRNISVKNIDEEGNISYNMYSGYEINNKYNNFIYQYIMSVIYYAFQNDDEFYIDKIVVNCKLKYIEKSTGMSCIDYVASIALSRTEYFRLNFDFLDAKDCFIHHNGITSDNFIKIRPISPIASFDTVKELSKKNSSKNINLATLPWREFEIVINNLLNKTYRGKVYDIELTQATRDGGVDIIVHDYDPINGGTILVQVKRYSHIVGIEAVRSLYGILGDHGAMKGILITTSHFGKEARNFVKNKPLTLIDGEELLKLLAKSGFSNFYINSSNYK